MNLSSFNRELLNDRLEEYSKSLDRALSQHSLLTTQLESLKKRFERSVTQGRKSFSYKYSMQISSTTGVLCMYEEYMKRKAKQIKQLKLYQQHLCRLERTSTEANSTEGVNNAQPEAITDSETQSRINESQTGELDLKCTEVNPDDGGKIYVASRKRTISQTDTSFEQINNNSKNQVSMPLHSKASKVNTNTTKLDSEK